MATLLARQAAAFRREHHIAEVPSQRFAPAPSLLLTPGEVKAIDADSLGALGREALAQLSVVEPDVAAMAPLFDGPAQDRDMLSPEANARLNKDLRHAMLLISPHMQSRPAQELMDVMIQRHHAHRFNVDDILACTLPHHDSPWFTKLVQGLQVAGNPTWNWLSGFRKKPATLMRASIAKYCAKDLAVLTFICDVITEFAKLHKHNQPLASFFSALWMETLATQRAVSRDLVSTVVPTALLLLRRPHLSDLFHAGLFVAVAVSAKVDLEASVRSQLLDRVCRQLGGEHHRSAAMAAALLLQLQVDGPMPAKALKCLLSTGAADVTGPLDPNVDSGNFLASTLEACLAEGSEGLEDTQVHEAAKGLVASGGAAEYAEPLAAAVFQSFISRHFARAAGADAGATATLQDILRTLHNKDPASLGESFRQASEFLSRRGLPLEPLVKMASPACALVSTSGEGSAVESALPLVQALVHADAAVRRKAVAEALQYIASEPKKKKAKKGAAVCPVRRLIANLLLQSTKDEDLSVVQAALAEDWFWSDEVHVNGQAAAQALKGLLARLLETFPCTGQSMEELFASGVAGDAATCSALASGVHALRLVCQRGDCDAAMRVQIDTFLLPFVAFSLVAGKPAGTGKHVKALGKVIAEYCAASSHRLFSAISAGAAVDVEALAGAVDPACAAELCELVAAAGPAKAPGFVLGGMAARAAVAVVLATALPRLVGQLGAGARDVLRQGAEACQGLAHWYAFAGAEAPKCPAALKQLLSAAIAALGAADKGKAEAKAKKQGAELAPALVEAASLLLEVVMDRPRFFADALRQLMALPPRTVFPALLRVAMRFAVEEKEPLFGSAPVANALQLLHSLAAAGDAAAWPVDAALVPPLVCQLASCTSKDVRSGCLDVLEVLVQKKLPSPKTLLWESPCSQMLGLAGALLPPTAAMPQDVWAKASTLAVARCPAKALTALLQQVIARRVEIAQDRGVVAAVFDSFFRDSKDEQAAADVSGFWAAGCAMLPPRAAGASRWLLEVLPAEQVLSSLQDVLPKLVSAFVAALAADPTTSDVPELLRVALLHARGLKAEGEAQAVLEALVSQAALPLCDGLAGLEQKLQQLSAPAVELAAAAAACAGNFVRLASKEDTKTKLALSLLKLVVAASLASSTASGESKDAELARVSAVAAHGSAAFVDAAGEPALLLAVLKKAPAFKVKQLSSGQTAVAADLLCRAVVAGDRALEGWPALLLELGKSAAEAAGQIAKEAPTAARTPAQEEEDAAVFQLLAAAAALSEHLASAGKSSRSALAATADLVPKVCQALATACQSLGKRLSGAMLGAVIRACGALSGLVPDVKVASVAALEAEAVAPPLQTCLLGLRCFEPPLPVEVASLLRENFSQLWRQPPLAGAAPAMWDAVAQCRLRLLLHAAVSGASALGAGITAAAFAQVAGQADAFAWLDFATLLFIAQRSGSLTSTSVSKKRRRSRKRDAAALEDDEEAEDVLMGQEAPFEELVDEAFAMLTAVAGEHRYLCLATLMQSLCALAAGSWEGIGRDGPASCWGLQLLPKALSKALGERLHTVVAVALRVASRVVAELGLPEDLDGQAFDGAERRPTALAASAEGCNASASAAVCYAAWAACALEAQVAARARQPGGERCQRLVQELRALLLRSLAVTHPMTFLRATGLALQVPGQHPELPEGDFLALPGVSSAYVVSAMAGVCQALEERSALTKASPMDGEEADVVKRYNALLSATMRHVAGEFLPKGTTSSDATQVVAWQLLERLSALCAQQSPKPVVKICAPAAIERLGAFGAEDCRSHADVAVACAVFLETVVGLLGRQVLEKVNDLTPTLLKLIAASQSGPVCEQAFRTLIKVVGTLGSFLSPFLEDLVRLVALRPPAAEQAIEEQLGREVSTSVPVRLLLPAVQAVVGKLDKELLAQPADTAALKLGLGSMQRLACLTLWLFPRVDPEAMAASSAASMDALLKLVASGSKVVLHFLKAGGSAEELPGAWLDGLGERSWRGDTNRILWHLQCSGSSVRDLHGLAAGAFAEFALRLDLEQIKPCVGRVLEWARAGQTNVLARQGVKKYAPDEAALLADSDAACRWVGATTMLRRLSRTAPGVAEVALMPLALPDVKSSLVAARRCALRLATQHRAAGRKRRRAATASGEQVALENPRAAAEVLQDHTWWWFEVASSALGFLREAFPPGAVGANAAPEVVKLMDDSFETLMEPCVDLLDIFEFLPSSETCPTAKRFADVLEQAIVSLVALVDGAKVKTILTSVLGKTRSEDVEIRLAAVRACHKVWTDLGVQVVSGLSEVVMFASELLEDEDSRVETAVRLMIKTMEECTGESLQDTLKS